MVSDKASFCEKKILRGSTCWVDLCQNWVRYKILPAWGTLLTVGAKTARASLTTGPSLPWSLLALLALPSLCLCTHRLQVFLLERVLCVRTGIVGRLWDDLSTLAILVYIVVFCPPENCLLNRSHCGHIPKLPYLRTYFPVTAFFGQSSLCSLIISLKSWISEAGSGTNTGTSASSSGRCLM